MSDPETIGRLAVAALSMGAEAVVKSGIGEVVKDVYKNLKERVSRGAGRKVESLEDDPDSTKIKQTIAASIDSQPEEDQAAIKHLALALNEALLAAAGQGQIGVAIERLEAANVALKAENIHDGTAYKIGTVKTPGDFSAEVKGVGNPKR